jgi:hypothetical protein
MDIDSMAQYNRGRAGQNSSCEPSGCFVVITIGVGVSVHSIEFLGPLLPVLSRKARCDGKESDQTRVLPAG